MKLYTEYELDRLFGKILTQTYYEGLKGMMRVVELPSDEEIESSSFGFSDAIFDKDECFVIGAKWMKEQILNQKGYGD